MPLKLMSVEDAAAFLTVSPQTIRVWAREGRFRWFKLGGRMLIDHIDLELFVIEHARGRAAAAPEEVASHAV